MSLVSRRVARHGGNLALSYSDGFFVEKHRIIKARFTFTGMIFTDLFDFFFKSLEKEFSTDIVLPLKVSEGTYVRIKVQVLTFIIGYYNLLDSIIKLDCEKAVL